jgi:hypothetical protein
MAYPASQRYSIYRLFQVKNQELLAYFSTRRQNANYGIYVLSQAPAWERKVRYKAGAS